MSLKIGVIISTTRPTRVGHHVANWFVDKAKNTADVEFEIIDLKAVDLPLLSEPESASSGRYTQKAVIAWSEQVKTYDGFVVMLAEYNNGYPAPLKNALDTLYKEWERKPIAFVGYGTYGAARAIEQLATVSAKLGMMPLTKTTVGILRPWDSIGEDGSIKDELIQGNIEALLKNLTWWGETLKAARENG